MAALRSAQTPKMSTDNEGNENAALYSVVVSPRTRQTLQHVTGCDGDEHAVAAMIQAGPTAVGFPMPTGHSVSPKHCTKSIQWNQMHQASTSFRPPQHLAMMPRLRGEANKTSSTLSGGNRPPNGRSREGLTTSIFSLLMAAKNSEIRVQYLKHGVH